MTLYVTPTPNPSPQGGGGPVERSDNEEPSNTSRSASDTVET